DVRVELVDVAIPRLRGLLGEADLASYAAALAAGQRAIDAAGGPRLAIDLALGSASVDGRALDLSEAELVWLAALAVARVAGPEEGGWLVSAAPESWAAVARACRGRAWTVRIKSKAVRALLGHAVARYDADADGAADLTKLRADTKRRIAAWCKRHAPAAARVLVPEGAKRFHDGALVHFQRLPLAAAAIAIRGLPAS